MKKYKQLRFPENKKNKRHYSEETRNCENSVYIKVKPDFKDALIMVLDELNAIYRFENDKLVMYEPEFKHFLGFMRPVIDFCFTLNQKEENDKD